MFSLLAKTVLILCGLAILATIIMCIIGKKAAVPLVLYGVCVVLLLGIEVVKPDIVLFENLPTTHRVAKSTKSTNEVPNKSPAVFTSKFPAEQEKREVQPEQNDAEPDVIPPAKPENDGFYRIGDTWTVDGQWSVTVTGVSETSDRNIYSDKNPDAVYILDYTYTNLGYEDEYSDGIVIDLGTLGTIVDDKGMMAYEYSWEVEDYPKETPVGATCMAQACVGVDNAGDFKIIYSKYDNNSNRQTATFLVEVK